MKLFILFCITCFCFLSFSDGRSDPNSVGRVRAVNLGGWIVTEGWIKPSLFDGIINNDFLDGTALQFKSGKVGKYLSTEAGGGTITLAPIASSWETFRLWRIDETTFNLRDCIGRFVGMNTIGNGKDIIAEIGRPGATETFQILRNPNDLNRVRIKAPNGFYLQVKMEEIVSADYEGNGGWGDDDDDPSVFTVTIIGKLQGEFQVTNGYGPHFASQVMKEHWSTFIVEEDFKFIKENGLNAVRIPVGWWIASDPFPPKPYVPGSLHVLDNAFSWAEKYGIYIIIDLHAALGSQNGAEHSSSRDGSQEWGQTDDNIQQTVDVIKFLSSRYANSSSFLAMELMNEPLSPGVSLDILTKYYKAGYDAVRKYSETAYVVLSNRLGPADPTELFRFANGLNRSTVDVHYYPYYNNALSSFTVDEYVEYIYKNQSEQVKQLTTSNGPPILVGEWTAEWQLTNTSKEDYKRYAAAQTEVFGRASFGWAYWTLKNANIHWSLEWMIKNGYIKL
ncbi:putative glucan 1,3-beta-glucosidase A [Sesamum alatum]|uniref:Glucan 1,3-beta-glucosidase A n=1 Tax=Sesamum alatum TaxID=300844 RepID=A0AAE2CTS0_9LAMI|nr:putative glucan 1,3-beta-glucosidase A [Sesamum alatum]